VSLRTTTRPGE